MPSVAIVILNYNGGHLLRDCVSSFLRITICDYRIIVVDNASVDGSANDLEAMGHQIQVIRSRDNLGYTGGNNLGIQEALRQDFDYILLVNNDTLVHNKDFLSQMVDFCEKHSNAGIVGPKVFFQETSTIQNTICDTPFFLNALLKWPRQKLWPSWNKHISDKVKEVDVVNGVCILFRSKMLQDIGLLDPLIFMYREDTDIAIRARRAGWKSYYLPCESIVHLQKDEGYDYNSMVNFLLKRNAVYVLKKHGYWFDAVGQAIGSLTLSSIRALWSCMYGDCSFHWSFVRLIFRAHLAVFGDKVESDAFGPPNISWKIMISSANSTY